MLFQQLVRIPVLGGDGTDFRVIQGREVAALNDRFPIHRQGRPVDHEILMVHGIAVLVGKFSGEPACRRADGDVGQTRFQVNVIGPPLAGSGHIGDVRQGFIAWNRVKPPDCVFHPVNPGTGEVRVLDVLLFKCGA